LYLKRDEEGSIKGEKGCIYRLFGVLKHPILCCCIAYTNVFFWVRTIANNHLAHSVLLPLGRKTKNLVLQVLNKWSHQW
jgi:hypothetical protein